MSYSHSQPSSYQPSSRPLPAPGSYQHPQSPSHNQFMNPYPSAASIPMTGTGSSGGYSSAGRARPNLMPILTDSTSNEPLRSARKSSLPSLPLNSSHYPPHPPVASPQFDSRQFTQSPSPSTGLASPLGSDYNPLSPPVNREKKANPLEDLIQTETAYVDDLGTIIKVSTVPEACASSRAAIPQRRCNCPQRSSQNAN